MAGGEEDSEEFRLVGRIRKEVCSWGRQGVRRQGSLCAIQQRSAAAAAVSSKQRMSKRRTVLPCRTSDLRL